MPIVAAFLHGLAVPVQDVGLGALRAIGAALPPPITRTSSMNVAVGRVTAVG